MGAFLARLLGQLFAAESLRFVAGKALFFFLFYVVLPLSILKGFYYVLDVQLTYVSEYLSQNSGVGDFSTYAIHFTGLGAWLAVQLHLPQCLSLIFSALSARFVLNLLGR